MALALTRRMLLFAALPLLFAACDRGDYLGPVERTARTLFNGWDLWSNEAVRPYETPMPLPVAGAVPTTGLPGFAQARAAVADLHPAGRVALGKFPYRRYCHHCHGPNGDGRIIVGESLDVKPADLRSPRVQALSDRQIYDHLVSGGMLNVPLAETMTPQEMLLAISYLRSLAGAPSRPFFGPPRDSPTK